MALDVLGSKEAPKNGRGQNGFQGASSVTPGKTAPPLGNKSVAPPAIHAGPLTGKSDANSFRDSANQNASGDHARLAKIQSGGVDAHSSMPPRTPDNGSPGGVNIIPAKSNHSPKR